ncbi:MAG: peroxiredoxin [Verrucomicrobiia bacterium]
MRTILVTMCLGAITAAAAGVPKVGAAAPAIECRDQANKPWSLADTLERHDVKAVLLYFYPKDDTPGCTKQALALRDNVGTLAQKGVQVVGVSFDTAASHQRFIKKCQLNFTLLADPKGKVADAYGVRIPKRAIARRVSFLISKDGKTLAVFDNRNPAQHLPKMQAAIKAHLH